MDLTECKVDGCTEAAGGTGSAKGFCTRHYQQHRRGQLDVAGKALEHVQARGLEGVQVVFQLPKRVHRVMLRRAEARGVPLSEVLREACDRYVKAGK